MNNQTNDGIDLSIDMLLRLRTLLELVIDRRHSRGAAHEIPRVIHTVLLSFQSAIQGTVNFDGEEEVKGMLSKLLEIDIEDKKLPKKVFRAIDKLVVYFDFDYNSV